MGKQTNGTQQPKAARQSKTNHQTGWHKPIVNPTTNYAKDSHKAFCKRCVKANDGVCPITGNEHVAKSCDL